MRAGLVIVAMFVAACAGDDDGSGTWMPPDAGFVPTTYWDGDVTTPTVWTTAMCPIVVREHVDIGGAPGTTEPVTLTIEPGCEVRFDGGTSGITVHSDGAIRAIGTADQPITLRILDEPVHDPFRWEGVTLYTNDASPLTRLEYVTIEHTTSGIRLFGGHPRMQNVTVRDTALDGIELENGGGFSEDSFAITSTQSRGAGMLLSLEDLGGLPPGCDFSNNAAGGVRVRESYLVYTTLTTSLTLRDINASYVIADILYIDGPASPILTLEAGVTLAVPEVVVGAGEPGGLRANGTAAKPVTFTSNDADPFLGIDFSEDTIDSEAVLVHTRVVGASGGIFVRKSIPTLQYVELDVANQGLAMGDAAELSAASTGLVIHSDWITVRSYPDGIATLPSVDSDYGGPTSEIWVDTGTMTKSGTWHALGAKYVLQGTVAISGVQPTTITIDPGTRIEAWNAGFEVGRAGYGDLIARGTPAEPIVFTGTSATKGSWKGLFFHPYATSTSVLEHVVVENGGSSPGPGVSDAANIYVFTGGGPSITNATVTGSAGWGIYVNCYQQQAPSITNVTYGSGATSNTDGDLNLDCP